ncbi:2,3-bisphosphoglycerate-dependent phosphoglycerate mutase [Ascoidea rubescens DSM 1968]|uniref:Phosphoglycerate mutase n=1 Tax=Ascoidea rubescens DSM 1968 TaxID=1344418 RepID=A0A1D2VI71_9ASCO|nr:phosphoglycerate mutase [Ascoidea rubescens DSM 1968]ODV61346.1 phosphoglycerate mutase [Ascoidea rubescens DSM 1968]
MSNSFSKTLASQPKKLILVRHGQSEWNEKNLFTGWVDVKLTEKGRSEAQRAGVLLKESGLKPDILYTSKLSRAIQTANIALETADRLFIDVKRTWRLNERHYGDLQGKDKSEALNQFGPELFKTYRRSYDTPPPPIADDNKFSQFGDERYKEIDPNVLPKTESLKLVIDRLLPYWQDEIARDLLDNKTVLVVAHGNSLRGLYKHLTGITAEEISEINIPTGIPLVFELDSTLNPIKPPYYLDPEAAAAGAAAVAAQGQKK